MQRNAPLCVLFLLPMLAQADTVIVRREPVVVYEGRSTVSAQPYYVRLERNSAQEIAAKTPNNLGVKQIEKSLPLIPSFLEVGKPTLKTQAGQLSPLFVMGMDRTSLEWFAMAAAGLAEIGAQGVVVEASNRDDWQALRQQAQSVGIELMLLAGDSLAKGYGINTYPVVIVSPESAGLLIDE